MVFATRLKSVSALEDKSLHIEVTLEISLSISQKKREDMTARTAKLGFDSEIRCPH